MICLSWTGSPRVSSHFHQEFPSLQAAGEVKDGQEEEPYGPGPSLRPQSMDTARHINIIQCSLVAFFGQKRGSQTCGPHHLHLRHVY